MFNQLLDRLAGSARSLRQPAGSDISTPAGRRSAVWHALLMDHGLLRTVWSNLHEVAPGVWRSNQPSPRRLRRFHEMGIRGVINLRGAPRSSYYLFEEEACRDLGLVLVNCPFSARRLPPAADLLRLLDLFRTVPRPFVMHCKSGADRSGLAAALYLMAEADVPVAEARKQLGLRYLHLRGGPKGVLSCMLDAYARDTAETPMPIRQWLETRYDPVALQAEFDAARGRRG